MTNEMCEEFFRKQFKQQGLELLGERNETVDNIINNAIALFFPPESESIDPRKFYEAMYALRLSLNFYFYSQFFFIKI